MECGKEILDENKLSEDSQGNLERDGNMLSDSKNNDSKSTETCLDTTNTNAIGISHEVHATNSRIDEANVEKNFETSQKLEAYPKRQSSYSASMRRGMYETMYTSSYCRPIERQRQLSAEAPTIAASPHITMHRKSGLNPIFQRASVCDLLMTDFSRINKTAYDNSNHNVPVHLESASVMAAQSSEQRNVEREATLN